MQDEEPRPPIDELEAHMDSGGTGIPNSRVYDLCRYIRKLEQRSKAYLTVQKGPIDSLWRVVIMRWDPIAGGYVVVRTYTPGLEYKKDAIAYAFDKSHDRDMQSSGMEVRL